MFSFASALAFVGALGLVSGAAQAGNVEFTSTATAAATTADAISDAAEQALRPAANGSERAAQRNDVPDHQNDKAARAADKK